MKVVPSVEMTAESMAETMVEQKVDRMVVSSVGQMAVC